MLDHPSSRRCRESWVVVSSSINVTLCEDIDGDKNRK